MRLLPPLAMALAVLAASPLAAHETFVAAAGPARVGQPLPLRLSSTARFPRFETAVKAPRITAKSAVVGIAPQVLGIGTAAPAWLNLATTPDRPGVLRIAVVLGPKSIALTPAKVDEYFAEIEADAAVRTAYAALPAPRQWDELYTKHAKALICVAPCSDTTAAQQPAGHVLEFMAADAGLARFVLLAKGKPLAGQPVQLVDPAGSVVRLKTDATGLVNVPATTRQPWLLATTILRPPARAGAPFTSDFATLWRGPN